MVTTEEIDRIKRRLSPLTATPDEIISVINTFEDFLRQRGYHECNIAACNCGSWHGGHSARRLQEIHYMLSGLGVDCNGKSLQEVIRELALTAGYHD